METKRKRTQRINIVADSDDDPLEFEFDSDCDPEFVPEEKVKKPKPVSKRSQRKRKTKGKILYDDDDDEDSSEGEVLEEKVVAVKVGVKRKKTSSNEDVRPKKKPALGKKEKEGTPIIPTNMNYSRLWKDEEVIAETTNVPVEIAANVINLLNQDCTIPFIARYRKEMTGCLSPEKLRDIQASHEHLKIVCKKVESIFKAASSSEKKFDDKVAESLLNATSLSEVELLYAPYKPGSKKTLAERSRQNGLEPISLQLLEGKIFLSEANLSPYVKPNEKGLETEKDVLKGIQHIIADIISKDRTILDFLRKDNQLRRLRISSGKTATADKLDKQAYVEGKQTQNFKYENYFQLDILVSNVKPHQVLALNRGENQKILKVKVVVPTDVKAKVLHFIWDNFCGTKYISPETSSFLRICVEDAYERLIEPHLCRQIRTELTKKAEKESIDVFCSNLKSLLLTSPVRGKTVLGIDPGFTHGCKLAVVSSKGEVLRTDVIYPHKKKYQKEDIDKIADIVLTFGSDLIAIGNGTACRETETWLSSLINTHCFKPLEVKYCIINESGASIYSVTKEAELELPGMDPNIRSAVSIARRLQDPLLEYVKVEPKHLGVGMYQEETESAPHDVSETHLRNALDSVVVECVSFVGVDLNVCPEFLLKKISGLNAMKAKQIVEWRGKNGSFVNRSQLRDVKGLGPKSFEQCAGFVKILSQTSAKQNSCPVPETTGKNKRKCASSVITPNPLDATIIHPESYDVAERFLKELKADPSEIGLQTLVDKVNSYMKFTTAEHLAERFSIPVPSMQLIVDAFKQLQEYDIRGEFDQPLFLTTVQSVSDLKTDQELTGCVRNVTHFGAFIDIGVGRDGMIHVSRMKGQTVNLGDRVLVSIRNVDKAKGRIELELKAKL